MPRDGVLGRPLDEREAFTNFIEAMKIAESSAKQIAFMRSQPGWIKIENSLAAVRALATTMAIG